MESFTKLQSVGGGTHNDVSKAALVMCMQIPKKCILFDRFHCIYIRDVND